MNWIQPKFTVETLRQPRKKQRLDTTLPETDSSTVISYPKSKSDGVSWIEKHKPISKNDLIVHKKKIAEVEAWLQSLSDEKCKIMLLTGPPGSGKLTTLKVLCKELKVQTSEWITPPIQDYDPENFTGTYCSQQRVFEEFLIRASRYSSVLSSFAFRRIVIVKDIPNVFLRDPSSFHEFLLKYNSCEGISVVFIITENSLILDLFPETIKNTSNVKTVNFNPVTKKSVNTVLNNIIKKERLNSSVESSVISEISNSCGGDLRNAVMSLNFICTKGCKYQVSTRKTKSKENKEASSKLCLTDPSMDLFHGLGRVLYAKKNEDGSLSHDPRGIVDSFSSNTNTFINMLQENYLSTFSDINSASRASYYLSVSDYLVNDMNDTLISRDIALSVSVSGLMCSNNQPSRKFQQFNKSKCNKAKELSKSYSDCVKAVFYSSCPRDILLDSVSYLNKMSKNLETEAQRRLIKELSSFYLMDKNV